jgi:hypothetical protein
VKSAPPLSRSGEERVVQWERRVAPLERRLERRRLDAAVGRVLLFENGVAGSQRREPNAL